MGATATVLIQEYYCDIIFNYCETTATTNPSERRNTAPEGVEGPLLADLNTTVSTKKVYSE